MTIRRKLAAAATALALVTLSACAEGTDPSVFDDDVVSSQPSAAPTSTSTSRPDSFPVGSSVRNLMDRGKIVIGVKYDQPGIGEKNPATGEISGFDIEIAKLIAFELGIPEEQIEFKETISGNREPFIQNGTVDFVVASYSITDDRRTKVGQAGPYYETGQQLLVRKDETAINRPEDLPGKKVCSVAGSTSIKTIEEKYGATPAPFGTYTECVNQLINKAVDAVSTDGAILLGYASRQPDKLKVVGEPFSTEKYGIGFKKDDADMCKFLRDLLEETFENGAWADAFAATLGKAGVSTPAKPTLDATC
ncbi:MAG: glutamate ABC transporter substrate-binding protein [Sporichthyaceae bacterium]